MTGAGATAREIRDAVRRGEVTAAEVARRFLDQIAASDARLGAFVTVSAAEAEQQAAALDAARPHGKDLPLDGVPVAVKDNICTRGIRTTACSRILGSYTPPYDATSIARLKSAGAVILGKTNCDEFAMGSSTEHSAFGPTRNPWSPDRTPGGSSGGSAAAVAARQAPAALGSDTGGSIRQPAAFCGVVGVKPTYGRVSRYGLVAFASSLDQIGPIALTTFDVALFMNAIAGLDPADATTAREPVPDFTAALSGDVRGLRVGVPRAFLAEGVDTDVERRFGDSLDVLKGRGAAVVDVALPHARFGIPVYYLIAASEASSNLARYDGVRYGFRAPDEEGRDLRSMYERTREAGFGAEVKRRIMLGTYALSAGYYDAYYVKAQQVRTLVRRDFDEAFRTVDLLALPTSPTPPFALGERVDDPLQMYLADVFTVGASLAGLPALSMPAGFTPSGLPVGTQIVGRAFDEATLLRVADACERDQPWWRRPPPITT